MSIYIHEHRCTHTITRHVSCIYTFLSENTRSILYIYIHVCVYIHIYGIPSAKIGLCGYAGKYNCTREGCMNTDRKTNMYTGTRNSARAPAPTDALVILDR